ncbi:MAG TPA: TadE family protein, partial [Candidatus Dormibacteraeota bacterium]
MRQRAQRNHAGERGQVAVLFAISLVVLLILVGIAIDGGFGLFQYRKAQNAADFAAVAAAQALQINCTDKGGDMADGTQITNVIDDLVNANAPDATSSVGDEHWTAYYLNDLGKAFSPSVPVTAGGAAVEGACGVHVDVQPQWPPFIEQIMGVTKLQTAAGADALSEAAAGPGPLTSIVGLAENGAHTILEAGNGLFTVNGTIYDNANGHIDEAGDLWGGKADVIDGKQNGDMDVVGDIESVSNPPFDWCFGSTPPNGPSATCSANNTTIQYEGWSGGHPEITTDPVASNGVPNPLAVDGSGNYSHAACPGNSVQTYTRASQTIGGNYLPGVYTYPVAITGNAVLENCSQAEGDDITSDADPGIFIFESGLTVRPKVNDTVTGNDVMLVTINPPTTVAGVSVVQPDGSTDVETVANAGSGEPVIGTGADDANSVNGRTPSTASQGLNDALEIGGQGSVTLTPPQTGSWTGYMTWQDPDVRGNIGLDAFLGDTATINISGIVYNNSDQEGQDIVPPDNNPQYWGAASSLPFLNGGMLVAGFGIDSRTGQTCSSASKCQVTINGLAIVDIFQT